MKKTKEKIEEAPAPQTPAEEPKPRFLGDPTHAQALLSDPERRNDGILYVAAHGFHRAVDGPEGLGAGEFDDLTPLEKAGLLAMVTAIVQNPHAEPYASSMPANHYRKAYRALDDALRDAMGYARYRHAD